MADKTSRLVFGETRETRWQIADPQSEQLAAATDKLRHGDFATMTVEERLIVLNAVSAYQHLTCYPLGTEHAIKKLRAIRARLKERAKEA